MVTNTTQTTELVETGEVRDRLGRTITPAARRAELVAAWGASGRTQAAFARSEGVNYTTFCSWVQEQRTAGHRPRSARRPLVRFAEVRLPAAPSCASGLEVRLPDGTLVRGERAADLAQLVRALRD